MKLNILEEETDVVLDFIHKQFDNKKSSESYKVLKKIPRIKSAAESTQYRKKGNELYKTKDHNQEVHENVWINYTKSIALAPNDSEELAHGYGNRSALLFHLKKFVECAINCDKAIIITKSDNLKLKLLYRKAQCLFLITEPSLKESCDEAIEFLKNSSLSRDIKKQYKAKFNNILSNNIEMEIEKPMKNLKLYTYYRNELSSFTRHKEVPCASQSVAIKYNKKWGKHVVATQDIPPGEIISIEENFCMLTNLQGKYLSCSYCNQFSWVSFPCENCIDDIYCSKNCQHNAWAEYHQYECSIYPYYFKDASESGSYLETLYLRLYLKIIYKAGGFQKIMQALVDIENCKDQCSKGFTKDRVWNVQDINSFYSLVTRPIKNIDAEILHSDLHMICRLVFLLAQETTFFGKKKYSTVHQMTNDPEILFAIILFLRTLLLLPYNMNMFLHQFHRKLFVYGSHIGTFLSLFNHSCDPNVEKIVTKNNQIIIYSKHPIKKGSQLFVCYFDREQISPFSDTKLRRSYLCDFYDFVCDCLPCAEDWSCQSSIMSCKDRFFLLSKFKDFETSMKAIQSGNVSYSPVLMEDVVLRLEWLAENFTVHCEEYEIFAKCLKVILQDLFGSYRIEFPEKCDTFLEF